MRKVTLFIASSLDNFIARLDGGIDWLFSDGDYGYERFYDSIDTVLMGRKTYETAVRLGEGFSGKECYVFTRFPENDLKTAENIHLESDPPNLVKRLRLAKGKDIFLEGGGETISAFLNDGLIDEIVLSVHPIILGGGIPLFNNVKKEVKLQLMNSTRYQSGLVQLHYQVLGNRS